MEFLSLTLTSWWIIKRIMKWDTKKMNSLAQAKQTIKFFLSSYAMTLLLKRYNSLSFILSKKSRCYKFLFGSLKLNSLSNGLQCFKYEMNLMASRHAGNFHILTFTFCLFWLKWSSSFWLLWLRTKSFSKITSFHIFIKWNCKVN